MSRIQFPSILLLQIIYFISTVTSNILPPSCNSEIYCYGKLLHTVQMASVYPDSKTFVDMKMKENASEILKKFDTFMIETKEKPTVEEIKVFINNNFDSAGSEFEDWTPSDWISNPKFLEKINDIRLKNWAKELHGLWRLLGRKMKSDVEKNSNLYSIIPVPNPVIVPGGRFREFYYWDSYWIIRGLLHSEMYTTVKGMLGNFMTIIDRFGFIPNGGRIYYLMRSQPPLLIPMVDSYLNFTNDYNFLKDNIKYLEKEFQFWLQNRTVKIVKHNIEYTLCRYQDSSSGPRPESYREDINTAQYLPDNQKDGFYSELKTAAESGWDFSSRWFIPKNGEINRGNLTDIKIKSVIPVDLNSIIYWNAKLLVKYFKILGRERDAEKYNKIANNWLKAVTNILWHEEDGIWLDYDLINHKKRDSFYPSNLAPLWTKCYELNKENYYIDKIIKYIDKSKVFDNPGGIPTSIVHSGEQWDYPNAWPPLQDIIIRGLDYINNRRSKQLAFDLALKWVLSNYKAYQDRKAMYEKYDATIFGGHGGGGEYEVQIGFGWTNGIIIDLLSEYGNRILITNSDFDNTTANSETTHNSAITLSSNHFGPIMTLFLAFGATITAGCVGAIVYTKRYVPKPGYTKLSSCRRS